MDSHQDSFLPAIRRAILAYATRHKIPRTRDAASADNILQFLRDELHITDIPEAPSDRERLASDLLSSIFSCATAIFSPSDERRERLARLLDETTMAYVPLTSGILPKNPEDLTPVLELRPDLVVVDIPTADPDPALHAIALLRNAIPFVGIFAVGIVGDVRVIVTAMRNGAGEFIDATDLKMGLFEALTRFSRYRDNSDPGASADTAPIPPPGPPGGSLPPLAPVGVPRITGPRSFPPRKAAADLP